MINPLQLSLSKSDGTKRNVIIEPILENSGANGLDNMGKYKIFKDAFGEESKLFTEPLEFDEPNTDLSDNRNPDYLGTIFIYNTSKWNYEGDLLTEDEQNQIARSILSSKDHP